MAERPTYLRASHYTVELSGGPAFEVSSLDEARRLFVSLRGASSETEETLNLVVWSGRSARDGGPPTGYILDQHTWNADA